MRVSLQDRTVHESARISFVGVAYQIFFFSRALLCSVPFEPRRETGAASSAEPRYLYLFYYFFRFHGTKDFFYGLVSVYSYVILDVLRIDDSAVSQNYSLLFCHELLILFGDGFILRNFFVYQMTLNYSIYVCRLYFDVSGHLAPVIVDIDYRFQVTGAYAACSLNVYAEVSVRNLFFKFGSGLLSA